MIKYCSIANLGCNRQSKLYLNARKKTLANNMKIFKENINYTGPLVLTSINGNKCIFESNSYIYTIGNRDDFNNLNIGDVVDIKSKNLCMNKKILPEFEYRL